MAARKHLITAVSIGLASAIGVSAAWAADTSSARGAAAAAVGEVEGYAKSPDGPAVKTPYDGCVRTPYQDSSEYLSECGYEETVEKSVEVDEGAGVSDVTIKEAAEITRGGQVLAAEEIVLEKVTINNVQFPFNSAELTPAYKAELDNVAEVLAPHRPLLRQNVEEIVISGYTDSTGPAEYNQNLSERRAQSVADYLMGTHDVRPDSIIVKGLGEEDPIADNATKAGQALNRRVEIKVIKN